MSGRDGRAAGAGQTSARCPQSTLSGRSRDYSTTALPSPLSVVLVRNFPSRSAIVLGRRGWRNSSAVAAFCPPLDGEARPVIGLDALVVGAEPVAACMASNHARIATIAESCTIATSIVRPDKGPERSFELIQSGWWSVPMAAATWGDAVRRRRRFRHSSPIIKVGDGVSEIQAAHTPAGWSRRTC